MDKLLIKTIYVEDADKKMIAEAFQGELEVVFYSKDWSEEYYREQLAEATVIMGEPKPKDLTYCKRLKLMQITWSGVDYYVNSGTFPDGAVLCSMTGEYGQVLSDYAVGMVHALCFAFPHYLHAMDMRRWKIDVLCKSLENSSVLIVGAGDIGRKVATKLRPSGVKEIIGVRRRAGELPEFDSTVSIEELPRLLPNADIAVLSLPGTISTAGLFDEKLLRSMKDDAVLVNVGRGTAIDLDALSKLMAEGKFWGVGLDVTSPEPLPESHPLWTQERCFVTPHIAGNTYMYDSGTDRRIKARCIKNIRNFLEGAPLISVVDFSTGYRKS